LHQGWKKYENRRKEKAVRRQRYSSKRPETVRRGNKFSLSLIILCNEATDEKNDTKGKRKGRGTYIGSRLLILASKEMLQTAAM
jgi:hypothetical protein